MKRQNYYPNRTADQVPWLENFRDKLGDYATPLDLAAGTVTAAVADARWLIYVLGSWLADVRSYAPACTEAADVAQTGSGSSAVVLPVFTAPALPAGVVAVNPGALNRLFALVQVIKAAAGFTEAIGTDLGVIGAADSAEHPVPKMDLTAEQGDGCQCVKVAFVKYGHTGVYIEGRRGGGAWEFLGIDTESPYQDARPLLVASQPEVREFRMRFWDKGAPNGPWTDIGKVTVSP